MTRNQIAYRDLKEQIRHNTQVENETNRHSLAYETETRRANIARERENQRSNIASETIRRNTNFINASHWLRADTEQNRSNLARERENFRSNRASELIRQTEAQIKQQEANTNASQLVINQQNANTNALNAQTNITHETNYAIMARASIGQMEAAKSNAIVNSMVAPSEIARNTGAAFNNYMSGIHHGTGSVSDLTSVIKGIIPTGNRGGSKPSALSIFEAAEKEILSK